MQTLLSCSIVLNYGAIEPTTSPSTQIGFSYSEFWNLVSTLNPRHKLEPSHLAIGLGTTRGCFADQYEHSIALGQIPYSRLEHTLHAQIRSQDYLHQQNTNQNRIAHRIAG